MWVVGDGGWVQTILETVQLRLRLGRPCQHNNEKVYFILITLKSNNIHYHTRQKTAIIFSTKYSQDWPIVRNSWLKIKMIINEGKLTGVYIYPGLDWKCRLHWVDPLSSRKVPPVSSCSPGPSSTSPYSEPFSSSTTPGFPHPGLNTTRREITIRTRTRSRSEISWL